MGYRVRHSMGWLGSALFALGLLSLISAQEEASARTSRFAAGPIQVEVRFLDGATIGLEAELRRVLTGALEQYRLLFGGLPRDATGAPLDSLVVEVRSAPVGGGESDPGLIQLTVGKHPVFGFYDWRLTLLHEAFHLWSAESFRYASGHEQWFSEGASEFYALQTAVRLGLIEPARAAAIAGMAAGFYVTAEGLGELSLREAGSTPARKARHYFLVYDGGWLAVLTLDRDIRSRTANSRSMDDLMRWLYAEFDREQRRYTMSDLVSGLQAATGLDYGEYFQRYVDGREVIPLARFLNLGSASLGLTLRDAGFAPAAPLDPYLLASLGADGE